MKKREGNLINSLNGCFLLLQQEYYFPFLYFYTVFRGIMTHLFACQNIRIATNIRLHGKNKEKIMLLKNRLSMEIFSISKDGVSKGSYMKMK